MKRLIAGCCWMMLSVGAVSPGLTGCSAAQTVREQDAASEFQPTFEDFHKLLKWTEFEAASKHVSPLYRETFLGRYDGREESFHIATIDVKRVAVVGLEAELEVEQEWYVEPAMTVRKDRFIELWKYEGGVWLLRERLDKEEFRKRNADSPPTTSTQAVEK
jgi:hypothetical protein